MGFGVALPHYAFSIPGGPLRDPRGDDAGPSATVRRGAGEPRRRALPPARRVQPSPPRAAPAPADLARGEGRRPVAPARRAPRGWMEHRVAVDAERLRGTCGRRPPDVRAGGPRPRDAPAFGRAVHAGRGGRVRPPRAVPRAAGVDAR